MIVQKSFIERPFNLNAREQTFSNYKSRTAIKYLVGITPSGAVSFLSAGWGGRASDKEIARNSAFLDKVTFGDCVLADKGFLIEYTAYHLLLEEGHKCLQKKLTSLDR